MAAPRSFRRDSSVCRSIFHFAFKHRGTLGREVLGEIWFAFRAFVLNGETLKRPLSIPVNFAVFPRELALAWRRRPGG